MSPFRSLGSSPTGRLIVLGVLWGATFPISRLGVGAGAGPFELVLLDFLVAAAVTIPWALRARLPRPTASRFASSAAAGALLIGGINLPLYWGVQYATGGLASIFYAASPLVSLGVLWVIRARPELHTRQLLALVLGLGGVIEVAVSAGGAVVANPLGLVAFGIGAVCQGTGAVLLGRLRPTGEDRWGEASQFLGGAVASGLVMGLAGETWGWPSTLAAVASVAYVGGLSMAVGYAIYFDFLHHEGAVRANRVTLLNPVVALLVGVVAFGEAFRIWELAGLALVLVSLGMLMGAGRPSPRPTVPPGRARVGTRLVGAPSPDPAPPLPARGGSGPG